MLVIPAVILVHVNYVNLWCIILVCVTLVRVMFACVTSMCVLFVWRLSPVWPQENQKDLERCTEVLSEYLERDITQENLVDIKQKVQDKYR